MNSIEKNFDKLMGEFIQNEEIAGASICVKKDNRELFFKSWGMQNKEQGVTMKRDTIFRLFSMTKPITATAAMILFERGELDLFAPLSRYLTGFANPMVLDEKGLHPAAREVQIRDLLNMTSGICYPDAATPAGTRMVKIFDNAFTKYKAEGRRSTVDFINELGCCPLAFEPGERWRYGFSADVLGAVVEAVSGKSFGQFLKDEIFCPLGMVDTDFFIPEEKRARFSEVYENVSGRLVPFTGSNLGMQDYFTRNVFESGGAGLVSTIDDYARFAMMLCNEGTYETGGKKVRILGRNTVRFMRTPQLTEDQRRTCDWDSMHGYSYGNLMRVLISGSEAETNGTVGEFGWDGWTGNYFTVDPENKMVILYFIQRINISGEETRRRMRSIAYSVI